MKKSEFLSHWSSIEPGTPLCPCPVPYKHEGSTYAEDGIRITGSRRWIDSVLSNLKPLLANENGETRLQVVYKQSTDRHSGQLLDSWNCYIQVHERGRQAVMLNCIVEAAKARRLARAAS